MVVVLVILFTIILMYLQIDSNAITVAGIIDLIINFPFNLFL